MKMPCAVTQEAAVKLAEEKEAIEVVGGTQEKEMEELNEERLNIKRRRRAGA